MKIEHIAIYVKDLEAARDFFTGYFGAPLQCWLPQSEDRVPLVLYLL